MEAMVSMNILPLKVDHHPIAGRLSKHLMNWKLITRDQWVLNTVRGYSIEFLTNPIQARRPQQPELTVEQAHLVQVEIAKLLRKQAISAVTNPVEGFYSNLFLVPKKDGGQRPVINLKALNQFIQTYHFKMEGMHTLKEIIRPDDWLTKVDLKDAFFTIPMSMGDREYLRFTYRGETYQFNCLPFGLSPAPWVFTKTLKPAVALCDSWG